MPSTSTAASAGRTATPMVVRAWRPRSPKAATIRSEAPFITFGTSMKSRRGIDEAAEPDHAGDLVEIAERRLELCQQIDRAGARGGLAVLDRHVVAELAGGDQLAFVVEAELARDHQEIAGAHERHVIGDRRGRRRQCDAEIGEFLFNGSRHGLLLHRPPAACPQMAVIVFADPASAGKRRRGAVPGRCLDPSLKCQGQRFRAKG